MRVFFCFFLCCLSSLVGAYDYCSNGGTSPSSECGNFHGSGLNWTPSNLVPLTSRSVSFDCVSDGPGYLASAYGVCYNNADCVSPAVLNLASGACELPVCPEGASRDGAGQCVCTLPQVMNGAGTACITPDPDPPCESPNTLINGVCTAPCPTGQTRVNGICTVQCTAPKVLQNGICVDPAECPEGYEKVQSGGWCAEKDGACDLTSPNYDPIKCDRPKCQFGQRRAVDGNCYSPGGGGDGSGDAGGGGGEGGGGGGGGDAGDPADAGVGGADGCPDGQALVNGKCANQADGGGCPTGTTRGTVNGVEGCYGSGGGNGYTPPAGDPDTNLPGVDGCPAGQIKVNETCVNQTPGTGGCPAGTTRGTVGGVESCYVTPAPGGSNNNQEPPTAGQCDPTKNNYAECIGQLETPEPTQLQTVTNDMSRVASDAIIDYGETLRPEIEASEALDLGAANSSTSLFLNMIPQPASCDSSSIHFTLSGHSMQLDCSRFERLKVWFGWALWLMTVYSCIVIATSSRSSGG